MTRPALRDSLHPNAAAAAATRKEAGPQRLTNVEHGGVMFSVSSPLEAADANAALQPTSSLRGLTGLWRDHGNPTYPSIHPSMDLCITEAYWQTRVCNELLLV